MPMPDGGVEEGCCKVFRSISFYLSLNSSLHIVYTLGTMVCEQCGRRFIDKSKLDCHNVAHTGQYRFSCPLRDQRFQCHTNWVCTRALTPSSNVGYAGSAGSRYVCMHSYVCRRHVELLEMRQTLLE